MKKFILLLLFFSSAIITQAQRTIPYPIIFVHGWIGSDSTWYGMGVWLRSQGLNVSLNDAFRRGGDGSLLDFHLNADGNNSKSILNRSGGPYFYGDVYDYNSDINPENDVFFVNFNNYVLPNTSEIKKYSNQAAAVKQGFAVGLAVKKVLNATKAKKVILVGHSMGGLAIREYIQNSVNWQMGDSDHHVAKLVTIGTPNSGSNSNSANILLYLGKSPGDERSEAVRDLRHKRDIDVFDRGVYLFGGYEENIYRLGSDTYFNTDIDCDNSFSFIQGLNQKQLPTFVPYSCVIGEGFYFPFGSFNGDGIVEKDRASLIEYKVNRKADSWDDIFYITTKDEEKDAPQFYSIPDNTPPGFLHGRLTKQALMNTAAIDEPSHGSVAFSIDLDKNYIGFLTKRPNNTRFDSDLYKIFVSTPGVLTVNLTADASSNALVNLYDQNWSGSVLASNKSQLKYTIPKQGTYYIEIKGFDWTGSEVKKYSFNTSFCVFGSLPFITSGANSTICEGQSTILSADAGFDAYYWFKDAQGIPSNSPQLTVAQNQLTVFQAGNYTLKVEKCGVLLAPDNRINVTVNPLPTKPIVRLDRMVNNFLLNSSSFTGNQWFYEGKEITGATGMNYVPEQAGNYTVKVTEKDCSNQSQSTTVSLPKPSISYVGSTAFFEGDSIVLIAPARQDAYIWTKDDNPLTANKSALTVKQSGTYRVGNALGKVRSPMSDPVIITVNPILSVNSTDNKLIRLYPNPNTGKFWVETPEHIQNWEMTVVDLQGRVILKKNRKGSNLEQIELKSHGKFLLKVNANSFSQSLHFVID